MTVRALASGTIRRGVTTIWPANQAAPFPVGYVHDEGESWDRAWRLASAEELVALRRARTRRNLVQDGAIDDSIASHVIHHHQGGEA